MGYTTYKNARKLTLSWRYMEMFINCSYLPKVINTKRIGFLLGVYFLALARIPSRHDSNEMKLNEQSKDNDLFMFSFKFIEFDFVSIGWPTVFF